MQKHKFLTKGVCISFLMFVLFFTFQPATANVQTVSKEVENAVLAEEWQKVVKLLEAVAPETPDPVLRLIKGHAALAVNKNNDSLCLFLSVLPEDDQKDPKVLKKWDEWTQYFVKRNPKSAVAYYFWGDALARLNKWDDAVKSFNTALELNPKHAMSLNARGVVHAAKGEWDNARNDLKKATETTVPLADAFASRGTYILQRKTDAKIAMKWFEQALQISPDYVIGLNGRGGASILLKKWDMAEPDFKAAKLQSKACLSGVAEVVDLNFAILINERNKAVMAMLTQEGIQPGMSLDEKIRIMDNWTPVQRQRGFDLLNNAKNFNDKIQGGFWNPSKTELGISGGIKDSLIGPKPFIEGKASATWDWENKAGYNQNKQTNVMNIMKERYGITKANSINDLNAWGMQHLPGMDYEKITKPGGVSSREIGEQPVDTGNWNVLTLYGLLYKMRSNTITPENKEK